MIPALRRLVASASVLIAGAGATAVLLGPVPGASAAPCGSGQGVTVVVDFGAQGQGLHTTCDPAGASKTAAQLLDAAYGVTYVQRQPGFLCRINGVPAEDPCVNTPPATAYWGLFHSDGRSGSWVYSSLGAGGVKVPDGGYVGVAWQSGGRSVPGLAPAPQAAPTPTPTQQPDKKPSSKPSKKPRPQPTQAPATPTPTSSPTSTPTPGADTTSPAPAGGSKGAVGQAQRQDGAKNKAPKQAEPGDKASGEGGDRAGDTTEDTGGGTGETPGEDTVESPEGDVLPAAAEQSDGGLPTALVVGLLLAVVAAAGVGYRRRRTGA